MYRVVIADDEDIIREGLKTFVDWNRLGYSVAGEAGDGNKAYELVREIDPHLVLTDIKMPFCTGIELMDRIRRHDRRIKIAVLSGYDEFDYATAAIEAGALGYLLKPIKFDKLHQLLLRVKDELDEEALEQSRKNDADALLRQDLIRQLLEGKPSALREALPKARECGMPLAGKRCGILLAEIDDYVNLSNRYPKDEWDALQLELHRLAAEAFGGVGEVYGFPRDAGIAGFLIADESLDHRKLKEAAERFLRLAGDALSVGMTIGAGGIVSLETLRESYLTAARLLDRKFFLGKNRVITEEDATGHPNDSPAASPIPETPPWQSERLIALLQSRETSKVRDFVQSAFAGISSKNAAFDVYGRFVRFLADFVKKNALPLPAHLKPFDYEHPPRIETLEEILDEIVKIVTAIMGEMDSAGFKRKNRPIEEVKQFIESRYADNLSLESAARHIHVHPMYLSKIFKKETGINFIEYLTEVRIAKAKQFLADDRLKIYEVSGKVGYHDPKHFSKVFKSAVGVTPYEYRNVVLGFLDDSAES